MEGEVKVGRLKGRLRRVKVEFVYSLFEGEGEFVKWLGFMNAT